MKFEMNFRPVPNSLQNSSISDLSRSKNAKLKMERVAEKSIIDIDAMCRMCHHKLDNENESVEIWEDETSVSLPVSMQIKIFAGIEVSSLEAMPKKLCLKCRLHLEKTNLVRNKCKRLESKLRKHLRIINAGRVSHVFDDGDDENEEEHIESIRIIESLSKQLGDAENDGCMHNIELEKERIYNELNALFGEKLNAAKAEAQAHLQEVEEKLRAAVASTSRNHEDYLERLEKAEDDLEIQRREAKLEREDLVAEMTRVHEAEIKRIKDEAEAKLKEQTENGLTNEPRIKRKHSLSSSAPDTVVLNGELVSIAVPVVDTTTYTILKTDELEFVEYVPYEDAQPEDEKVHPCGACEKEFSDKIMGKFRRQRNGIDYDFCSNSCAVWFDVIYDAEVLLKDDFTESEYDAWLEQNGPAEPVVIPRDPVEPTNLQPPRPILEAQMNPRIRQPIQRPQPIANTIVKRETIDLDKPLPQILRPRTHRNGQQSADVVIKREADAEDLARYSRAKFCYTCKKNIVNAGLSAKSNNLVANFCSASCLSRAGSVNPPKTVSIKREMMGVDEMRGTATNRKNPATNRKNPAARFYCEVCHSSYAWKPDLKRHYLTKHQGVPFNEKVVAQVRSV